MESTSNFLDLNLLSIADVLEGNTRFVAAQEAMQHLFNPPCGIELAPTPPKKKKKIQLDTRLTDNSGNPPSRGFTRNHGFWCVGGC